MASSSNIQLDEEFLKARVDSAEDLLNRYTEK